MESENQSIGEFFEHYNFLIYLLKENSNLNVSGQVTGPLSSLELSEIEETVTGVRDLKKVVPENETLVNRLLRYIHN